MALETKLVRSSIDWLRYSMPYDVSRSSHANLIMATPLDGRVTFTSESLPNARGYDRCLALTVGRVHYHTERPEQMISVEFTGSECMALHAMGFDFAGLFRDIERQGGHLTSIHFAIDVLGYGADHLTLENALETGEASTKARSVFTYAGGAIGAGRTEGTTYVGKSSSDRQLRVYNKAAERGTQEDWTRIELVVKGKRARSLLAPLIAVTWPTVARSSIGAFLSWHTCDWWQAAVHGPMTKMPKITRAENATRKWLLTQVLPSLKRELAAEKAEGGSELAEAFTSVVCSYHRSDNT